MQQALAQTATMSLPKTVEAGSAFSIQTSGSGKAVLYIVGPAQVLKRDVQLGQPTSFAVGDLHNAGHYVAVLVAGGSPENGEFDVAPAKQPANLSFLAKPSRISVSLHDGISGHLVSIIAMIEGTRVWMAIRSSRRPSCSHTPSARLRLKLF